DFSLLKKNTTSLVEETFDSNITRSCIAFYAQDSEKMMKFLFVIVALTVIYGSALAKPTYEDEYGYMNVNTNDIIRQQQQKDPSCGDKAPNFVCNMQFNIHDFSCPQDGSFNFAENCRHFCRMC
uniref:Uncharacterized protein n=1 Tax=Clytia hemisphaerica TaxID=252671 RepID=A0A7M5WT13_9CNID